MRQRIALLAVLAGPAAVAGCSDTQPISASSCSGGGATCVDLVQASTNLVAEELCTRYFGPGFAYADGAACPAAGLVGSCTLSPPDASIVVRYYAPDFDRATAASQCADAGGAFEAPTGPT